MLINTVVRFILGKEAALAIKLIRTGCLILESIRNGFSPNVAPFARELFQHLPDKMKAPLGPATEQEFVDAVYNVFSLFTRSRK